MAKAKDISTMSQEERAAVEARREYQRQWRAANRDRVRVHNERYWKKKGAEKLKQSGQENIPSQKDGTKI